MKTNKKAILGMLVAMILSLGVMNGINYQKEIPESNMVWTYMTAYGRAETTPNQNFAAGAYGTVMSSTVGLIYGAAFGGPVGLAVGLGVGL